MKKDETIKLSDVFEFLKRLVRRSASAASILIYAWFFLLQMEWFRLLVPESLKLDLPWTVALSLLLGIMGLVLKLEEQFHEERVLRQPFRIHSARHEAYAQVCEILSVRKAKRVDLLQFSGFTAISVLSAVAKSSPDATIRLLVIDRRRARSYDTDNPDYHLKRIQGTLTQLRLLHEDYPDLSVEVWSYRTEPGISGITIDDWLVAIGWHNVFPNKEHPNVIHIRGHATPAIVGVDEGAEPLLSAVRAQFEAVIKNAKLEYSFGPKASLVQPQQKRRMPK